MQIVSVRSKHLVLLTSSLFLQTSAFSSRFPYSSSTPLRMGWADTWDDILQGGSQRWKITCEESHQKVISHLDSFLEDKKNNSNHSSTLSVFCPLAGDDPIVHLLWKRGYSVTSIDLVPQAVAQMRNHFKEGSWMSEEQDDGTIIWKVRKIYVRHGLILVHCNYSYAITLNTDDSAFPLSANYYSFCQYCSMIVAEPLFTLVMH